MVVNMKITDEYLENVHSLVLQRYAKEMGFSLPRNNYYAFKTVVLFTMEIMSNGVKMRGQP